MIGWTAAYGSYPRGGKYLGRLDIIETSPDKAVARVDRRFQQGTIQEGDRVATRIKL